MDTFTVSPNIDPNFTAPITLFYSVYALDCMKSYAQKPVWVGDIPDLQQFRKNRHPDAYRELTKRATTEAHLSNEEDRARHFNPVNISITNDWGLLAKTFVDPLTSLVTIPSELEHQADILALMLSYEYGLSPRLYRAKNLLIEERTILDLAEFGKKAVNIVFPHRDQSSFSENISTNRIQNPSLHHILIACDGYGTSFVLNDGIEKAPHGSIIFHNGAMEHFGTLPEPSAPPQERTALILTSEIMYTPYTDPLRDNLVHELLERNTREQMAIWGQPLPQLVS
jgi:hypothetical protein